MSDIQQAVREKYGAIAAAVTQRIDQHRLLRPRRLRLRRPDHLESLLRRRNQRPARGRRDGVARLRQPDGAARPRTGPDGARPRVRRRHRRAALGEARRSDRQGLRSRHDRRDARARAREPAEGRRDERRVPEGHDRAIPLPDNSVDVIISNCVINLSSDKDAVLREAFRVLKPGGRFAVSDVVVRGDVPADIRRSMELWVGCIAGALEETEYAAKLRAAGFQDVEVEPWRVYNVEDARAFLTESGLDVDPLAPQVKDKFASAFIRARKPAADALLRPGVLLVSHA